MKNQFKPIFDSFILKLIVLFLLIAGRTCMETGGAFISLSGEDAGMAVLLYKTGAVLYFASVPIAGFLIAKGVIYTHSPKSYIVRMASAAVFAEVLQDFAVYGLKAFDGYYDIFDNPALKSSSSIYVTFFMGAASALIIEKVIKRYFRTGSVTFVFLSAADIILFCLLTVLLRGEQGAFGVLTVVALYLFNDNPYLSLIAVAVLQLFALGGNGSFMRYAPLLGSILTWFYSGEEGTKNNTVRIAGYALYPVCYLILVLIMRFAGLIQ